MGVNLTAPVVQLQVPFAMMLAAMTLHEKFTVLQAIGSALMLGGSFITHGNAGKRKKKAWAPLPVAAPTQTVSPQKHCQTIMVMVSKSHCRRGARRRTPGRLDQPASQTSYATQRECPPASLRSHSDRSLPAHY